MRTRHLLFLYRKLTNFLSEVLLSFVLAFIFYILYLYFQNPIQEQLHIRTAEVSTDYSVENTSPVGEVLGMNVSSQESAVLGFTSYDYRARIFDLYFKKNNSPLYGYGQSFVNACDKYGAPHDCTLLPAIAKIETDLCKTQGSAAQYNCWGYGGSGENRIVYKNYDQAIDEITRRLMVGYSSKFFLDPEYGELVYCGPHCVNWGDHVKVVQRQLKA